MMLAAVETVAQGPPDTGARRDVAHVPQRQPPVNRSIVLLFNVGRANSV